MPEKPRILVVDDDGPILLLMRSVLREFGFEAVSAASGQQAIEEAQRATPDLILLDRNMPGMSGDETLRALREVPALTETPILILSGEPIEPNELAALGADGAVLKPFDVQELVATIRKHVR
ncbi:MAG TPA: response regulator [Thermoanaerobaculia bacterium]|nr:response regulator [Thermoanaerobaculia bacterium]